MSIRLALLALVAVAVAAPARAGVVLAFSQNGTGNTTTFTANGPGTATTINDTNAIVTISAIAGATVVPFTADFNLSAHSTSPVSTVLGISQHFTGTFSFTSGAGGTGTNFLSGSFNDVLLGNGGGTFLILGASTPPSTDVVFTSDVISAALLGEPRSLALAFTAVSPAVSVDNQTLNSATASVSGNFSAAAVPEPSSLALALTGLGTAGLFAARRRRRRRAA